MDPVAELNLGDLKIDDSETKNKGEFIEDISQKSSHSMVTRSRDITPSFFPLFDDIEDFEAPFHSTCTKIHSKAKTRCASNLTRHDFIGKISKVVHVSHTAYNDFTELQDPSLALIVEELLDFALVDNPNRRKIVNGKKMFDDLTVPEIISFWTSFNEELKWLLDNFSHDIGSADFQKMRQTETKEKTTPRSADICASIFQFLKEDTINGFISDFLECLHLLEKYDSYMIESTSMDEIHDQFKHVIPLIAGFFRIHFRGNGQCKLSLYFSEIWKESHHQFRKEYPIIVKPDYVLRNADKSIMMPVEIYAPKVFPDNDGLGVYRDMNTSQERHGDNKFRGQHLVQHIGLMKNKVLKNFDSNELDTPVESVGMFVTKKIIHFSKVKTTRRHLSSFIETLLPLNPEERDEAKEYPIVITRKMEENVRENGLLITKSQWYIDLSKGLHRNALFIFLLHYMRSSVVSQGFKDWLKNAERS